MCAALLSRTPPPFRRRTKVQVLALASSSHLTLANTYCYIVWFEPNETRWTRRGLHAHNHHRAVPDRDDDEHRQDAGRHAAADEVLDLQVPLSRLRVLHHDGGCTTSAFHPPNTTREKGGVTYSYSESRSWAVPSRRCTSGRRP